MRWNDIQKKEEGFTLIETLVAISILLIVIIGPITVAQKGVQNAYYANEQVTAVFLAQEAIEGVRILRDSAALDVLDIPTNKTWTWYTDGSFSNECKTVSGCAYMSGLLTDCSSANSCQLKIDGNGKYSHALGANSSFTRKVYIREPLPGTVEVKVDVEWTSRIFGSGNNNRKVTLQTWIYDRYQRYEE
ncbi:MAG: prepilin-type N-terminal cleavage/methylation domain-containing protein [Candidatus Pacebacteria bacterium]|nr:prepilin-type N-terminal cleavage/methylation domain-containing protein [Candidatus Paceibacterota bacterium]MCF7857499.1 prepilin-type N-terminal cleavage/methylation domain-containing protein [Candidatus Paceibacterota bacterium]